MTKDTDILAAKFEAHVKADNSKFANFAETVKDLGKDVKTIKENHLYHIERDVSNLKADMDWAKWWMKGQMLGHAGSIGGILYLIIQINQ